MARVSQGSYVPESRWSQLCQWYWDRCYVLLTLTVCNVSILSHRLPNVLKPWVDFIEMVVIRPLNWKTLQWNQGNYILIQSFVNLSHTKISDNKQDKSLPLSLSLHLCMLFKVNSLDLQHSTAQQLVTKAHQTPHKASHEATHQTSHHTLNQTSHKASHQISYRTSHKAC